VSDLRDLYQEVIFDHNRHPRNFGKLAGANRHADGHNPLCGDKLSLYLKIDKDVITDIRFEGSGCAISTASASLMTERLKGMKVADAEALFQKFHAVITKDGHDADGSQLGKLSVLTGVRDYPARVKCATLAWHTLEAALHDKGETASTE
jgi:nitrogen fixation NifU-like protein